MTCHESSRIANSPRKRRRPAKSCEQCRRRKVRCDRGLPCGPCARSRSSSNCCSYRSIDTTASRSSDRSVSVAAPARDLGSRERNSTQSLYVTTPQSQDPEERAEFPGSRRHRDEHRTQNSVQASDSRSPFERSIQDIQNRIQHLERRFLDCDPGPESPPVAQDLARHPAEHASASPSSPGATLPGLHVTPGKVRLFGRSHWIHTAQKVMNNAEAAF